MGILKKLGIAVGALLALLILAAIIVPLVVDVDKYRPLIVEKTNERLNGELKLGHLSLSLWGQIRVQIQGLEVVDAQKRPVVSVSDAYLHIPFSSLLAGSPEIVFKAQKPALNFTKDKAGKLNVMGLMKGNPAAPAEPAPHASATPTPNGSGSMTLPAIATRARLGVELRDADVTYRDEATALDTQVRDLNLVVRDLSLSRTTDIELWADLDTKLGKTFFVRGPARLKAQVKPELAGNRLDHVTVTGKLLADDLEMGAPGLFEKRKGMATNADLALTASEREANITQFNARFFNVELRSSGTITNLSAAPAAPGAAAKPADPVVNFQLASNEVALKPWNELIPMLKDYQLDGTAKLDADAKGPSSKLGYGAKLKVTALTAKAPHLKAQPRFDALVSVVTDAIDAMTLTMKAPGNDLSVHGKMISFTAPRLDLQATSSGMDLDQLIEFPPPAKKAAPPAPGTSPAPASHASPGTPAASDYDALLEPMRANKMLAAMVANLGVDIKLLKAYGVKMTGISARATMRDLNLDIPNFAFDLWGGAIKANASTNMKPRTPTYRFGANVKGLDIRQAVTSQFELFKNTVLGKADFEMTGTGASYNPEPAKRNLDAKGKLRVVDATFATIDVGKLAADAINKAIDTLGDKVPPLKGKRVGNGNLERESKYESISSDFTIAGGKFSAPNFYAKAIPNQGIDLKGATTVGLIDYSLQTSWEIIDTYDQTGAHKIGADVPQVGHVDAILAEKGQPVKFPVGAGCTVTAPCYSYTQVPEALAKVALANLSGAATGRAKQEVQKRLQQVIPQNAPPAVQKGLEDLGKRIFGR